MKTNFHHGDTAARPSGATTQISRRFRRFVADQEVSRELTRIRRNAPEQEENGTPAARIVILEPAVKR